MEGLSADMHFEMQRANQTEWGNEMIFWVMSDAQVKCFIFNYLI